MTPSNVVARALLGALSLFPMLFMTSCTGTTTSADLEDIKRLSVSCSPNALPAGLVELDGTVSNQSPELLASRWAAATDVATKVAVCGGHLRVSVFTSSNSASTILFDGDLVPTGATEIAKLRSAPKIAGEAIATANSGYAAAIAALPQDSTDVVASLGSANEYLEQLNATGESYSLSLLVLTDGVQNVGVSVGDPSLTPEDARNRAAQVVVPDLSNATITFAGVGRVSGDQPPTAYADALKVFYETVCASTHATSCTVVTDYTGR